MIKVLSIAGSDPSSGAGIQADLKVFQGLTAFGMAVPAALTVQNSLGVSRVVPVRSDFVADQTRALLADIRPDAVKTGMLLTRRNVEVVAEAIREAGIATLVVDPVLRSTSGASLLQQSAVSALKKQLFPCAILVSPNIPEAEVLTGRSIRNDKDLAAAARILLDTGAVNVLIKGGHRRGPAIDTLFTGKKTRVFSTVRQKGEFHGTGCLFSAAITVFIGRGYAVENAVDKAKQFVDRMLMTAKPVGKGRVRYFQF